MHLTPNDVAALLDRLCLFGPVIYVGLWMTIHPGEVVKLVRRFAAQVADLEWFYSRDLWRQDDSEPAAANMQAFARVTGVAFVLFGLVNLIGIV
jgi:hypothetical protein